jgi:hypothetical protein
MDEERNNQQGSGIRTEVEEGPEGAAETAEQHASPPEGPTTLQDDFPWKEFYPGLPTVEDARVEAGSDDPILWVKAHDPSDEQSRGGFSYLVSGYSEYPLSMPDRLELSACFSFSGLAIRHDSRRMRWQAFGFFIHQDSQRSAWVQEDWPPFEWPWPTDLQVDESWQPRRFSEIVREYPDYELMAPGDDANDATTDETTPAKDSLPEHVAKAIDQVLRYLWQEAIEGFIADEPGSDEPHIFRALAAIDGGFDGHRAGAEELVRDFSAESDREAARSRVRSFRGQTNRPGESPSSWKMSRRNSPQPGEKNAQKP